MKGRIKSVNHQRGFAFVTDSEGVDRFLHRTNCTEFDTLEQGVAVTFDPHESPKGLAALRVQLADSAIRYPR